jgi:hypothetical protein
LIGLSREIFVCSCSTELRAISPPPPTSPSLLFHAGNASDLERLDDTHDPGTSLDELRDRLRRSEHWLVGELDGQIATYTWLHTRDQFDYPYMRGCRFRLAPGMGYGYGAWTVPHLRSHGLRRVAFVEELRLLARLGVTREVSVFVKAQLAGATRSLEQVGIDIVPLWRVTLGTDRAPVFERLSDRNDATPI